ncbi:tyrosine-type recombinase/integrase [Aliarcobacter lanthieri]|uniref:tyrosine-type recombinase/integrase n=1 Tax=Aliarcobacter lanthieri TaxID=1355374 RepID=UPI00047B18CA|nr:site-specific integrase [Aliarcobacter lanthieri]
MERTKHTGVYFRTNTDGVKIYYIRYKLKGKQFNEKVGSSKEGITAVYASKIRAKRVSIDRLKEDSPFAINDKKMNFDDAFNLYYENLKINTKDYSTTLRRYERHIKDKIGHLSLDRIDDGTMENLKKFLLNKTNPQTKKNYSDASINHIFDIIRATYNYINKTKKTNFKNPATGTQIKRQKLDNNRERYLNLDEIKRLFDEIENVYSEKFKHFESLDMLKTFLILSFTTGARLSSVTSIRKQDINLDTKAILIKNHKTKRTYIGYLHPNYEEFIKGRMDNLESADYLVSGNKNIMTQPTLNYHLKPILDSLFNVGIGQDDRKSRVVIHTFRHTFASLLAIQGTPIYTIMKLLDHSDIKQTLRYAKLSPDSGSLNVFALNLNS